MEELILKKCGKCGALVHALKTCECPDCGLICCGEKMQELKANSVDAAFEKHVPTYEINGDTLVVRVNHVMESEHYIEWICLKTKDTEEFRYLTPKSEAIAEFKNVKEGILYSYCNLHGLWKQEIK